MSNIHDRYHISDGESFMEAASSRLEAFNAAVRMANRSGLPVKVFDTMARFNAPEKWTIHPGSEKVYTALVDRRRTRKPVEAVEHIDGDPTNNDVANLRVVKR